MNGRRILPLILLASGLLVSCQTGGGRSGPYRAGAAPTPARGEVTVTPGAAAGFLATGYQPLETWMDERFRVRYENMPLNLVFEQKPISDIRYQLQNLPGNAPLFFLISQSISRRELLKEISKFYGLDMRVEMVNGQPGYVIVSGRGGATGALSAPDRAPASLMASVSEGPSSSAAGQSPYPGIPRAKPAIEEGTAVPVTVPVPQVAAGTGSVTVEAASRP